MEWLPIESAPRDGRFYLAYENGEMFVQNSPPGCYAGVWHKYRSNWTGSSDGKNPTHWTPLPAPPTDRRTPENE